MQFSIDNVLSIIDQTVLNPIVSGIITLVLYASSSDCIATFLSDTQSWSSPLAHQCVVLFGVGSMIRASRYLSKRALNNGVNTRFHWEKEIILITGAAGGIGASAAQKLAKWGSKIVIIDVIPLGFPKQDNMYYYQCDLTDFEALKVTAAIIKREIGEPTCVVANAGICRGKPLLDASQRDIELTFGVNNLGLVWTAKTFLPAMAKKNRGHFLIIASQAGFLATAGIVDYAASKSAALAIYEGLHTEMKHLYKAPNVRISCISPSAVRTKMFKGIKGESNFFLPRLTADDLGELISNVLWKGESQNIMTPAFAYISLASKILPEWMRIPMQDGGADMMTELKPHKPL